MSIHFRIPSRAAVISDVVADGLLRSRSHLSILAAILARMSGSRSLGVEAPEDFAETKSITLIPEAVDIVKCGMTSIRPQEAHGADNRMSPERK